MNTKLQLAVAGLYMQAEGSEIASGGNAVRPNSLPPVTPQASDPNSAENVGKKAAQSIIAAEQGVIVAEQSRDSTKMTALQTLANLTDEMDRRSFIGGMQVTFQNADGLKLAKTHQNFITDARKVANWIATLLANKDEEGYKKAVLLLKGTGGYADKMKAIPRQSAAGGSNRGTGTGAVATAAIEAAKNAGLTKEDIEKAAAAKQALETGKPAEGTSQQQKPTDTSASTTQAGGSKQATRTETDIVQRIETLHENELEVAYVALANRLKKSAVPQWQECGAGMFDLMGLHDQQAHNQPAAEVRTGTEG